MSNVLMFKYLLFENDGGHSINSYTKALFCLLKKNSRYYN